MPSESSRPNMPVTGRQSTQTKPNKPLKDKQKRQFVSWWVFSVFLPLVTYVAVALAAIFFGVRFSLADMLGTGDLLFLVIIWLAMSIDWTLLHFLELPKARQGNQINNYVWFGISLVLLILYAVQYGLMLMARLSSAIMIADTANATIFCVGSVVGVATFCGFRYYCLLQEGNL